MADTRAAFKLVPAKRQETSQHRLGPQPRRVVASLAARGGTYATARPGEPLTPLRGARERVATQSCAPPRPCPAQLAGPVLRRKGGHRPHRCLQLKEMISRRPKGCQAARLENAALSGCGTSCTRRTRRGACASRSALSSTSARAASLASAASYALRVSLSRSTS